MSNEITERDRTTIAVGLLAVTIIAGALAMAILFPSC
jgi:hypothetical protein